MALDKNKILSELGNVVNQLQSADCGCMGKLFNNNQANYGGGNMGMSNMTPSYGHGCHHACHHGHGHGHGGGTMGMGGAGYGQAYPPCAGEPTMNQHCMGKCNPAKLYSDTYGYLNQNLMQPVVQEVYNDLKSLTADNTIANNPLANQMGLTANPGGAIAPGNQAAGGMGQMGMDQQKLAQMGGMAQMSGMAQMGNMAQMGGMGPGIMKMMQGNEKTSSNNPGQAGNLSSPTGQAAGVPQANIMNNGLNPPGNGSPGYPTNPTDQGSPGMQNANVAQYMMQQNTNMPANAIGGHIQNKPNAQVSGGHNYGQHGASMKKFAEMFPGVMGGDLGFDPMSIAIQMNPANQHKAAMNTIHKLMQGGKNEIMNNKTQEHVANTQQSLTQVTGNVVPQQGQAAPPQVMPVQMMPGQTPYQQPQPGQIPQQTMQQQQMQPQSMQQQPMQLQSMQQQSMQQQPMQPQSMQQQAIQQQQIQSQPMQQQPTATDQLQPQTMYVTQVSDNNQEYPPPIIPSDIATPPNPQGQGQQQSATPTPAAQQFTKEVILPVDTSRNLPPQQNPPPHQNVAPQQHIQYNTLGIPVQYIPVEPFHQVVESGPQTLSPMPVPVKDMNYYSNVKNTVSKTALAGNRPVGRTPSRSQLQHIYNQYKGSQSYTQQNIQPGIHGGVTHSEGRLNVAPVTRNQAPVENVGGDSSANNPVPIAKVEQVIGQIGDVPAKMPPKAEPAVPSGKGRNGLQDVVFTSYPTTAAWSFHGQKGPAPVSRYFRNAY